ncbi:MAG TPA: DUF1415 domain-containing protein, partial [Cycloclasticus sp.]|nr:DUF1415 domain-containing protein [Cycloclasticus sp.]
MVMSSEQAIIEPCRQWVTKVIVGMNFCPFAKPVVESGAVSYSVINERSLELCLQALSDELNRLYGDDSIETSLLIYPVGFEAFDDYLELAGIADELLIDEGFEGVFQLATFHPDYCFEGQVYDDPANYTNRSPYPILHILREASVEKALESVANPDK